MEYFSSIFGGGFACPYDVGEKHGECWGGWEHYRATGSTDKKPVSLFKITVSKTDSEGIEMARNGVKRLRVVRSWFFTCPSEHAAAAAHTDDKMESKDPHSL